MTKGLCVSSIKSLFMVYCIHAQTRTLEGVLTKRKTMMLNLRSYQNDALNSVVKSFNNKIHKQVVVFPTGAGKTVLFIAITQHFQQKTLILAHRDELITQAYEKFKIFAPETDIAIFQGNQHSLDNQVIISSIQTCNKRIQKLKKENFKLLIIDEAHHAPSASYERIITELGFMYDSSKLLIGVTATPMRRDKKSMSSVFQEIVHSVGIDEFIKAKHLSPIVARRILTNFKIDGVKTSMGDFAIGELSQAINIPQRNAFVVNKWKEHAVDRKTIVFCANVQHCQDVAAEFNKHNIKAAAVWGDMNTALRKQTIHDFKIGKITVITSCGILTEGFDEPSVACVIMARPTKSSGLYTQMIGRGLRIDDSPNSTKTNCMVLDFTDQHNRLNTVISITNIMPNVSIVTDNSAVSKTPPNSHSSKRNLKTKQSIDEEFDIFAAPKFIWVCIGSSWSLTDDYNNEMVISKNNEFYNAYLYSNNSMQKLIVGNQPTLQSCKDLCEDYAQTYLKISYADSNSEWFIRNRKLKTSSAQVCKLQEYDAYKPTFNAATACTEIRRLVAKSKSIKRLTMQAYNKQKSQREQRSYLYR